MAPQTITLHGHATGPNPWKVAILMEELGVPFKTIYHNEIVMVKDPEYTKLNPNDRVPCIEDPNTGITLWESGAIIEYLLETYGQNSPLNPQKSPQKFLAKQFLFFQVSGQGPYFGQAFWFTHFHSEKVESARARYMAEIKRVTKVLDKTLAENEYLTGKECTYADLSFIPWFQTLGFVDRQPFGRSELKLREDCPNYAKWMDKMMARPAVKKITDEWYSMREELWKPFVG